MSLQITDHNYMNGDELAEFMSTFQLDKRDCKILCPSIIHYENGDIYKGEISLTENIKHGYGEYYYANGNVFAVKWANNVASGWGILIYKDGTEIHATWKNGILSCTEGTIKFPNGDLYEGQLYVYSMHGIGIYKSIDGEIYHGQFINGQRNGFGVSQMPTGEMYVGYWEDDTYHGVGILNTQSSIYKGVWENGTQHESGEIIKI